MTTGFKYFKCDWKNAPEGEPFEIFYECLPDGTVPKMAEFFDNGMRHWDDLAIYSQKGIQSLGVNSLVEGDFLKDVALQLESNSSNDTDEILLREITKQQFYHAFSVAKEVGEWCSCNHVVGARYPAKT